MRCLLVALLLMIGFSLCAATMAVNVLTLTGLPLSVNAHSQTLGNMRFNVSVSKLDALQQVMQGMNALSKATYQQENAQTAHVETRKYLVAKKPIMKKAGMGIGLAVELNIHQVPAVVFNKQYIVYGTTDVLAAYEALRSWQQKHSGIKA